MSFEKPDTTSIDVTGHRYLIVAARFNASLVDRLLKRVREVLLEADVTPSSICELRVPGSWELPIAIQHETELRSYDCVIALGVLIQGQTSHHLHVAQSVSDGLQMLSLNSNLPVINGIIVAGDRAQAEARAGMDIDRGREFAEAAMEMAALRREREAIQ